MERIIAKFYPIGNRTLVVFLLQSSLLIALLPIPLLLIWAFRQVIVSPAIETPFFYFIFGTLDVWPFLLGITLFLGWLKYIRYGIELNQQGIKVSSGLIAVNQEAIPYRRIQDVRIHRGLASQMLGVSVIVIALAEEDEANESSIILEPIEKNLAAKIQETIVQQSQIEQMNVTAVPAGIANKPS